MFIKGQLEEKAREWLKNYPRGMKYKPYNWVTGEIHLSKAALKSLIGGRRGGKSEVLVGEMTYVMDEAARTPHIDSMGRDVTADVCRPGIHIWLGAPRNVLIRQLIEYLTGFLPKHMFLGPNERARWEDDESNVGVIGEDRRMTARLRMRDKNGRIAKGVHPARSDVKLELKSSQSDASFQSGGLDFLGITEAQDFPEDAWKDAMPAVDSPGRLGRVFVEGISPDSNQHWTARLFNQCVKDRTGASDAFRIQTFDNPHLGVTQLRRILANRARYTSEEWDRIYLALLPKTTGSFFRNIDSAEIENGELAAPMQGRRYVGGLDTGRLVDKTVFVIMDMQTRRAVHHVVFQDREDYDYQVDVIADIVEAWNVDLIAVDATGQGGDLIFEKLEMRGLPVVGIVISDRERSDRYTRFAVALEQGSVNWPAEWSDCRAELEAIRVKGRNRGVKLFESVGNMHDDWVDAMSLCITVCEMASIDYADPGSEDADLPKSKVGKKPDEVVREAWKRRYYEENHMARNGRNAIIAATADLELGDWQW